MKNFRYDAMIKEFPFLVEALRKNDGEVRGPREISCIRIQRLDTGLLSRVLIDNSTEGSMVQWYHWEDLYGVFSDGSVEKVPVQHEYDRWYNDGRTNQHEDGHPVIDAMKGFKSCTHFILLKRDYEWTSGNNRTEDEFLVTIYKTKHFDLAGLIEGMHLHEEVSVQVESDHI